MIHSIEFATLSVVSFLTGKLIIATTGGDQPAWLQWIMGPLGALVVMVVAIGWLTRRLDATEQREIKRQEQREALLTQMAEINTKVATALESNTRMLERVDHHFQQPNT
jgi:uncharacterized membrane-anchored protein YhcB (DUF1043 family)